MKLNCTKACAAFDSRELTLSPAIHASLQELSGGSPSQCQQRTLQPGAANGTWDAPHQQVVLHRLTLLLVLVLCAIIWFDAVQHQQLDDLTNLSQCNLYLAVVLYLL